MHSLFLELGSILIPFMLWSSLYAIVVSLGVTPWAILPYLITAIWHYRVLQAFIPREH